MAHLGEVQTQETVFTVLLGPTLALFHHRTCSLIYSEDQGECQHIGVHCLSQEVAGFCVSATRSSAALLSPVGLFVSAVRERGMRSFSALGSWACLGVFCP